MFTQEPHREPQRAMQTQVNRTLARSGSGSEHVRPVMPYKDPADRRAHDRQVRAAARSGMPDLRIGRPAGFVVEGTSVEMLPVRPRWEAMAERCAICAHGQRFGLSLGAHQFEGQWHL